MRTKAAKGLPAAFIENALTADGADCILWPFSLGHGYAQINIGGKPRRVSRIVCERTRGPAPLDRPHAAHSCGNKGCVNPTHIRWASRKENEADKIGHGRTNRGERGGGTKLTAAAVLDIRARSDETARILAAEFQVDTETIYDIRRRRSWAWLGEMQ